MVHTIFCAMQWSQDSWGTPSGGQMQYKSCHLHQSQTQSPLVPGCSFYCRFQFQYQIQSQLELTCFPLSINSASSFSGIIITCLSFNSQKTSQLLNTEMKK